VWTTRWRKRQCWHVHSRCGLPGQRPWTAPLAAPRVSLERSAVAGAQGSRTRGFAGTPGHAVSSGPAGTARRRGRAVARSEGPRHHRPRWRHEAHRRGAASTASGPRKARARVVTKVRQSAQPGQTPYALGHTAVQKGERKEKHVQKGLDNSGNIEGICIFSALVPFDEDQHVF